jgi:hypothetical protein
MKKETTSFFHSKLINELTPKLGALSIKLLPKPFTLLIEKIFLIFVSVSEF